MQRQGQVGPDGTPVASPRPQSRPSSSTQRSGPRRTPVSYFKDVRNELRKVNWPTRLEVRNYSMVVFVTLFFMIALIFGLDYAFSKGAIYLFSK